MSVSPPAAKYDLKRELRHLYAPKPGRFELVEVPPLNYLAIDGSGDPNASPEYAAAVEALFGLAYVVKFHSKRELGRDFVVGPLEGLWRADDPATFVTREKTAWSWTMLIAQPPWIEEAHVEAARKQASAVRLVTIEEGPSVQTLHIGPYDDEGPTLARLHDEWMPEHGYTWGGDHHEIYLGDPRRTVPEKLRTVLRQPVRTVG